MSKNMKRKAVRHLIDDEAGADDDISWESQTDNDECVSNLIADDLDEEPEAPCPMNQDAVFGDHIEVNTPTSSLVANISEHEVGVCRKQKVQTTRKMQNKSSKKHGRDNDNEQKDLVRKREKCAERQRIKRNRLSTESSEDNETIIRHSR